MTGKNIAQECLALIRSAYPVIDLYTFEEDRVSSMCEAIAKTLKRELWVWTRTEGLTKNGKEAEKIAEKINDFEEPLELLRHLKSSTVSTLILLKDFHPYLEDPMIVRAMRSFLPQMRKNQQTVILTGPVIRIPRELEKDVYVKDFPLPTREEIDGFFEAFFGQNKQAKCPSTEERKSLVRSAQGLTLAELNRVCLRYLSVKEGASLNGAVDFIHQEKSQILRRMRALEFHAQVKDLDAVGGLNQLKVWLKQRSLAFSDKARGFGLPEPKGLFLLGVQGCGKSLMAKATAGYWKLPLLRMDVAAIMINGSRVDQGLSHMMDALKVADSLAPVVLWLDEIEKAFSGLQEGGALVRDFGTFITWMQEKTSSVFVVATANSIESLPPELLRKGRFDEIFFVDLPNIHERKEIFAIHLLSRQRKPEQFPLQDLAEKAEGFSGSEIEQVIVDALYIAFSENRELEPRDIHQAIEETVPLSTTMEESIKNLKEWARTRARRASSDTRRIDFFEK